ncbi:MAG: uracil-DNA glycosylase family protein [Pseudomonadota bacterium]
MELPQQIEACRLCEDRFADTRTTHAPRPVVWFRTSARMLIAGQAPGLRVHRSGVPFDDRSGDRLRDWLGLSPEEFYDMDRVALVPMSFCFPGYDASGSDLPPPGLCGRTWHDRVMKTLRHLRLRLYVGGYAHAYHLGERRSVTDTVSGWRDLAPGVFPLPHPSWRNTAWLKRNPWFETELIPALRRRVQEVLHGT